MFSHVFIGIQDFERAHRFYKPLMDLLKAELGKVPGVEYAGYHKSRLFQPYLWQW